jgi:hypothetical protein
LRLPRPNSELVALACGLAAAFAAAAGVLVSLHQQRWSVDALVRMHDTLPLATLAQRDDPSFRLRTGSGFYDGAYFYAIARDPLATGEAHRLIEEAPYRYGHPAYGWLTWLVSGGGRPKAVPGALLFVALASMFVAGVGASLLAVSLGWTGWGGLAVALNPGLVFSANVDTTEPLGAALLVFGLYAQRRGRRGLALALFATLCLVKEPLVLVPLAVAAWEYWRYRRPPWLALSVVPAAAWWLYLRVHLGAFPFGQGTERLTAPLLGWAQALSGAAAQSWNPGVDTAQLGQAAVPLIIVFGLVILIAAIRAARLESAVDVSLLVLAALYACGAKNAYQYPKDLIREPALVILLVPFVLAVRPTPERSLESARRCRRARRPSSRRRGS